MSLKLDIEGPFRRHYAEQVAVLSRVVGLHNLALVEDAVQNALLKALDIWPRNGQPDNPSGWLFKVARNEVRMMLRAGQNQQGLLQRYSLDLLETETEKAQATFVGEVRDDLLRMMLVVCDPQLPEASQIAFALKVLSGFSVREISHHLFANEESVYKRLQRARSVLAAQSHDILDLKAEAVVDRVGSAHQVLYAIFTQGHLSTSADKALRSDLCDEAIRLATTLAEHPLGAKPRSFALLALMHLVRARFPARFAPTGGLVLLEEQDRSLWDQAHIHTGLHWLERSATGTEFTRYHAEAGIAAEHCLSASFQDTRWDRIVSHYETLAEITESPVHRLNHAVATAELHGAETGLELLQTITPPTWLEGSYLWVTVAADLHIRTGKLEQGLALRDQALSLAPNAAIRDAIARRLGAKLA